MFRYGIPHYIDVSEISMSPRRSLARRPAKVLQIARHPDISYHSGRLGNALTGIIAS
jgi:hypothetical protein